jgi:hypothetical protein
MQPPLILALTLVCVIGSTLRADDTAALAALFAAVPESGGTVTIPPGDYTLAGTTPIPLRSHLTVMAYGARIHFPDTLEDRARRVMFSGSDIQDLKWFGGHFTGRVFDPAAPAGRWEPNANTRPILITTTATGRTARLTFRDLSSSDVAGAVVTVLGAEKQGSAREIDRFARGVTITDCTFERSGKFMWDYGFLWQITVWPEEYDPVEHALAAKYFRQDLVRGPLRIEAGDDRIWLTNTPPLRITPPDNNGRDGVCLFADTLPTNIVRGRQYYVVESTPEFIRIAETAGGAPLRFATAAGSQTKLISDLFHAHLALYAPIGSGPGKGALDLVGCEQVIVQNCRLSALGDTMHIQKSRGIVFNGNQITGSRMGAFFLAEYCQDAVITGNIIDGTNGSRVMSVEKSCEDVTIVGNTFRNGGRGSWINQPRRFTLTGNLFINNTTKCEPDARRGRRSFVTGDYERYAELYFTTHEPGGRYGDVLVRDNIFVSGDHATAAITFAPGGDTLTVTGNLFRGKACNIPVPAGCDNLTIRDNIGIAQD